MDDRELDAVNPDPVATGTGTAAGAARGTFVKRLRGRTVALIPSLLALGALSRYTETRTGGGPVTHTAASTALALLLAATLAAARRGLARRRNYRATTSITPVDALRTAGVGLLGLGIPLSLLAWSRHILSSNAVAVVSIMAVLLLALPSGRRDKALAVAAIFGAVLLIVGRTIGLGFPPVRAVYLGIVSGAVVDLAKAGTAIGGLVVAGALTAFLYRRLSSLEISASPDALALLLAPAAAAVVTAATVGGATGNQFFARDAIFWHLVAGAAALGTLSALVTLVRRSSPLTAAIVALTSFLPATFVTSRLQEAPFTAPMRLGTFILIAVVLVVRRTLPRTPHGTLRETPDALPTKGNRNNHHEQ